MLALHVSRRVGDGFWLAVGLAGFVVLFDSVLFALAVLALLVAGGGGGNPYGGIVVFFVLPLGVVAGSALCWLSYEMIGARRAELGVPGT
jgi:hypothetical protein